MRVEKHAETEKRLIEREVIRLDKDEIKEIILEKIASEGFDTSRATVAFNTKWKYVEDEWGMNRYPISQFIDIQIKL